jgi:hypothetical protein
VCVVQRWSVSEQGEAEDIEERLPQYLVLNKGQCLVHSLKSYRGGKGTALHILNVRTRWR